MLRNIIVLVTLVLVALLPFVTSEHKESLPAGVKILRDIQYVPNSTNPRQTLDLFLPRSATNSSLPLIVWIHGGGWIEGSKTDSPAVELARSGFAACAINYRLAPDNTFPAQIHDAKAAIRWLRAHASDYGIDEKRIGVWGLSAGGHLALLLATTSDSKELEGDLGNNQISSAIAACCDWCGPTDLVNFRSQCAPGATYSKVSPPDLVDLLLGGPVKDRLELAKIASPINYVSSKCPPTLIMHADNDPIVPYIQSQEFANALEAKNAPVTIMKVPSENHVFLSDNTYKEVIDFFTKELKLKKEPELKQALPAPAMLVLHH